MKNKIVLVMISGLLFPSLLLADGSESRPSARNYVLRQKSSKFDSTHGYDVKRYELKVSLSMTNDSLYGQQNIRAVKLALNDSLVLDCVRLDVDSVRLNGVRDSFNLSPDSLYLTADYESVAAGQSFNLEIFYRGGDFIKNGSWHKGYHWARQGTDRGGIFDTLHTVGYSMSEPEDARCWMPCFDQPWDKADSGCVISITIPDSFAAASNGLLQDTLRSGDRLTWRWQEDSAIATYLMCFTVSRFFIWSDTARLASGRAVPLNYFVWPEDSASSKIVFATVPQMARLYDSLFHPYPFAKYGMAAVFPFDYGGMEHQTMTTIRRPWIWDNSQRGIAHELAHMWYGDLVTCGTWNDIWLNEGFGSYLEAVYDESLNSRPPGTYLNLYFWRALRATGYPIYNPPPESLFAASMVYYKGAWVLQGLRWVMGDAVFFPMMQAYSDSFANGNAVTSDFQRIAEQHYGSSLQWYFDQWVYRAGHPIYYTVSYYKTHPDSEGAILNIKQTSTNGELYRMPIALVDSTFAGTIDTFIVWMGYTDTVVTGQYLNNIKWIKFDPDSWILKELYDSLPVLSYLTTTTKTKKYGSSLIDIYWHKYRMDSTCAGYNVYRADNVAGPFARINSDIIADTMFTDTTTYGGTEYFYSVTAVSSNDTCYETHQSNVMSLVAGGVEGNTGDRGQVTTFILDQNVPNPFKQSTMINYQLKTPGLAALKVYNIQGQLVKTLVNAVQPAGQHEVKWDGRDHSGQKVSSGIYIYCLNADGRTFVKKMQYVR